LVLDRRSPFLSPWLPLGAIPSPAGPGRFGTNAQYVPELVANEPRSNRCLAPSVRARSGSVAPGEHPDDEWPVARFQISRPYPYKPIPAAHAARYSDAAAAGSPPSNHGVRSAPSIAKWRHQSSRSGKASRPVLPASRVHWYPTAPARHNAPAVHAIRGLVLHLPAALAIAWLRSAIAAGFPGS